MSFLPDMFLNFPLGFSPSLLSASSPSPPPLCGRLFGALERWYLNQPQRVFGYAKIIDYSVPLPSLISCVSSCLLDLLDRQPALAAQPNMKTLTFQTINKPWKAPLTVEEYSTAADDPEAKSDAILYSSSCPLSSRVSSFHAHALDRLLHALTRQFNMESTTEPLFHVTLIHAADIHSAAFLFAFHHSICDGVGGVNVMKLMFANLHEKLSNNPNYDDNHPSSPPSPPPGPFSLYHPCVDHFLDIRPRVRTLTQIITGADEPDVRNFAGETLNMSDPNKPPNSNLMALVFSPSDFSFIRRFSKRSGHSIHCVLSAAAIMAFHIVYREWAGGAESEKSVPISMEFPINLRPFIGASSPSCAAASPSQSGQAAAAPNAFPGLDFGANPRSPLSFLGNFISMGLFTVPSLSGRQPFSSLCALCASSVAANRAACDLGQLGMMKYINVKKYVENKCAKHAMRTSTLEISNLGEYKMNYYEGSQPQQPQSAATPSSSPFTVDGLFFAQSNFSHGPLIRLTVLTTASHGLSVTIGSIVDRRALALFREWLDRILRRLAREEQYNYDGLFTADELYQTRM